MMTADAFKVAPEKEGKIVFKLSGLT